MAEVTFEAIQRANGFIKTTEIKGKNYAEVPQRIKAFRFIYPQGRISTELVSDDGNVCVFRAVITDEAGNLLGTGTAFEERGSTFINKTSYIENCETSAVGRALAMCGFGIDVSISSAEEVTNAINNQGEKPETKDVKAKAIEEADLRAKVLAYFNRHQMGAEALQEICMHYKKTSVNQLTGADCKDYIDKLQASGGNIYE